MPSEDLKHLHDIHLQLQDVEDQLAKGPKQVRAWEHLVERKREELDAAQTKLKELKLAAGNKNSDLRVLETKIETLRNRLNAATSNKEFDLIRTQIDADTAAKEVLEMEILEILERVDVQQIATAKLDREFNAAESDVVKIRQKVADTEPELRQRTQQLQETLREGERSLPGAIHESYRRLTQARGADALAPMDNKSCAACFTKLAPQQVVEVNTGKFVFCRTCGRLLYRVDDAR